MLSTFILCRISLAESLEIALEKTLPRESLKIVLNNIG